MSGLVVDISTGQPKVKESEWSSISGTIPALTTSVIDTFPLSEFSSMLYEASFIGQTKDDTRSFSMRVQQLNSSIKDQVFAKTGSMSLGIEAKIVGSNFILEVNNSKAFPVDYCVYILTS